MVCFFSLVEWNHRAMVYFHYTSGTCEGYLMTNSLVVVFWCFNIVLFMCLFLSFTPLSANHIDPIWSFQANRDEFYNSKKWLQSNMLEIELRIDDEFQLQSLICNYKTVCFMKFIRLFETKQFSLTSRPAKNLMPRWAPHCQSAWTTMMAFARLHWTQSNWNSGTIGLWILSIHSKTPSTNWVHLCWHTTYSRLGFQMQQPIRLVYTQSMLPVWTSSPPARIVHSNAMPKRQSAWARISLSILRIIMPSRFSLNS